MTAVSVLDQVARDSAPILAPFLTDRIARHFNEYIAEGEPVMGLEQALLSLAKEGTSVPADALREIDRHVSARAAEGGDVQFLLDPLAQVRRA